MVLVMGRRQLRVAVRPKKIRYGPGSACAVLSAIQRADLAAFVKILMTAQREANSVAERPRILVLKTPACPAKRSVVGKIKGSPNRGSFVFIEWIYQSWDGFTNYLSFE